MRWRRSCLARSTNSEPSRRSANPATGTLRISSLITNV